MFTLTGSGSLVSQQLYKAAQSAAENPGERPAMHLAGLFYVASVGDRSWGLLHVPAALVRGTFDALHPAGVELPIVDGRLLSAVCVFTPDEIDRLGGPDKLSNDRGKIFKYVVGGLKDIVPNGAAYSDDFSRIWVLQILSNDLQTLRRTYGLSSLPDGGKCDFHVAVAVRRKGVTGNNDLSKDTASA